MFRISAFCLLLISPAFAQKDFPDGPAKEYVNKICLQCHEPSQLLNQKRSESDWKTTVARMAKNFGKTEDTTKINMNKAKADEIVAAIGLTPDEARALVAYRDKHG